MKVALLGYASQGASAYEYWSEKGAEITIHDQDETLQLADDIPHVLGEHYLEDLEKYDLLIRTPAIHPDNIRRANPNNPNILEKVTTVTNEFFAVCPSKNIIGVTGTKGKGTTSTLIAKMLEASGEKVHLGGNIGIPPLELLKNNIKPQDYVVLELANFQIIDLRYSPHLAVCLMMVPEHLDWYDGYQAYKYSKKPLFAHQSSDDIAISFADNKDSFEIASQSKGKQIPYYSTPGAWVKDGQEVIIDNVVVCKTSEIGLLGEHNWQNICAAVTTVWQTTHDIQAISSVIRSFTGLEYRLELVRELDGVKYYNDSFGTTPETAIVAVKAFDQPKVLIVGGSDKGVPFDDLASTIASSNTTAVIAIGNTGPIIAEKIRALKPEIEIVEGLESMKDMVNKAKELSQPGGVVLLSTGCASFDLFNNYKDRGQQFSSAVLDLKSSALPDQQ